MKMQINTFKNSSKMKKSLSVCVFLCLLISVFFLGACSELEKPQVKPYIAKDNPPPEKSGISLVERENSEII